MFEYRREIDGLRGVAISSVVIFHCNEALFPGGFAGVDVFFVISGFLITSIILADHSQDRFALKNFYARRARRILPAAFFMAAITTVAAAILLTPLDLAAYGKTLVHTILFASNFSLAAEPSYFDTASQTNLLLHMWSLSVEEQFYLLWPLLLTATLSVKSPNARRGFFIALFIVSLAYSQWILPSNPRASFYMLPSRAWELLLGAFLALEVVPACRSRRLANFIAAAGLLLIAASLFLLSPQVPFPGFAALLPCAGAACFIYANTGQSTWAGRMLSLPLSCSRA